MMSVKHDGYFMTFIKHNYIKTKLLFIGNKFLLDQKMKKILRGQNSNLINSDYWSNGFMTSNLLSTAMNLK